MSKESLPDFSDEAKSLVPGRLYEHYKGMRYRLLYVARHSETLEELIIYQALYGDRGIWARPLKMFLETIIIHGESRQRFQAIDNKEYHL